MRYPFSLPPSLSQDTGVHLSVMAFARAVHEDLKFGKPAIPSEYRRKKKREFEESLRRRRNLDTRSLGAS